MPSAEPAATLDLAQLVERLRLAGFRVDTRQYLTAHELLLAYAAAGVRLDGEPERIIDCLGPIFCTSPEEQESFAREVAAWRGAPGKPAARPVAHVTHERTPFRPWRRARWWLVPLIAAVPIAAVLAVLAIRYYVPITQTGRVEVQVADGSVVAPSQVRGALQFRVNGEPRPLAPDGSFTIRAPRRRAVALEARLQGYVTVQRDVTTGMPASPVLTLVPVPEETAPAVTAAPAFSGPEWIGVTFSGESTDRRTRWNLVVPSAIGTALVAFAVFWLVGRARQRLALRQLPVHGDPELVTLTVPEVPILPATDLDLNRIAVALRRPREGTVADLDPAETVEATVRNAGFFEPRYSARRAMPEYVALVSRRGVADHLARTFDAVLHHLAARDVALDTYSFLDDPRTCTSDRSGEAFGLRSVLERHHRAALIVAGETMCAFDRANGRLAPWVEATEARAPRIFLTPQAPDRWTDLEDRLERAGFLVLPATEAGWRVLAAIEAPSPAEMLFPAPYSRPFPALLGSDELRWLDRNEPASGISDRLLRELKSFLGPDGFLWLCACGIYPEISWALTLRLRGAASATSDLAALSRLPWFRHGFMPEWLRRALVAKIPPAEERRLRTDIERLLEELAVESRAQLPGSLLHIGRWIGPIDLMRAGPAGSPLRDRVFLGFMTGAKDSLWIEAPRALARLFRRQPTALPAAERAAMPAGVGPFLTRALAQIRFWTALHPASGRAAAAAVIALIALFPLSGVLAIERVSGTAQSMWFVEVPEGVVTTTDLYGGDVAHQAFFISRTEVTAGQYLACVDDGACTPAGSDAQAAADPPDWPVRNVTWQQALDYCAWLEGKLRQAAAGLGPVGDALSGRRDNRKWVVSLPSDVEWEKAAGAGAPRVYPWGDTIDPLRSNYQHDSRRTGQPTAVGAFPRGANAWGLEDMSGNVAEWTRSWSGTLRAPSGEFDDPPDAIQRYPGPGRVVRGGSYLSPAAEVTITASTNHPANTRDPAVGFRVVIAPFSAAPKPADIATTPGGSKGPVPPPANSAPRIASLRQTPNGIGLVVTNFTFTASSVVDPDGDKLTYQWMTSFDRLQRSGASLTRTFPREGTFTVTLTVTDTSGASASTSTQVTIGSLDGVWEIRCEPKPRNDSTAQTAQSPFPTQFTAVIKQTGAALSGTLSGGGRSQDFPAPPSVTNSIRDPRQVSFGVESFYNVWDNRDSDFYFNLIADTSLRTMKGTSQYCLTAMAERRRPAAAK